MSEQATYVWDARVMPTGEVALINAYELTDQMLSEAATGMPPLTLISLERREGRQAVRRELTTIEDAAALEDPEEKRLRDMARRGEIALGPGGMPEGFWDMPMPEDPEGLVRRALIEDRDGS
jgi:hypothetical protein